MLLPLLLLWILTIKSANVTSNRTNVCDIIRKPTPGVMHYSCVLHTGNMEAVLAVIKQPHIDLLSIQNQIGSFVFGDNSFSPDLKYLGITTLFPCYISSGAFNASRQLIYLTLSQQVLSPNQYVKGMTAEIFNITIVNTTWTSPTFGPEWLMPITGLKNLELDHGNYSSFRTGEFCVLKQLQKLDLHGNRLESSDQLGITCDSLDILCSPCLPNVTNLDISDNPMKIVNSNLAGNVPHLRRLDISHCLLSTLNLSLLLSSNLEALSLNNNRLQLLDVHCQQFRNESWLKVLLLHNNKLQNLSAGLFFCVKQLRYLDLSSNQLSEDGLTQAGLNSLINLTYLDISYNNIYSLPLTLISNLRELVEFSCSGCRLIRIQNDTFSGFHRLKVLKLNRNNIHAIESGALLHLGNLQKLDLSQNNISETRFIKTLPSLEVLLLGKNNLLEIPYLSGSSRKLSTLILDSNNISKVDAQHLYGLSQLKNMSLAFNHIQHIQNYAFRDLSKLIELILKNNRIKSIGQYGLHKMPSLQHLRLDNNLLTVVPLFKPALNFLNLQTLNLSQNLIETFDFHVSSVRLQFVYMSHNRISKVAFFIAKFMKLRVLDLRYNNIHGLDQKYLVASVNPRPQLFLTGNPFHCDCNIEWILDRDIMMTDLEGGMKATDKMVDAQSVNRKIPFAQIADLNLIKCGISAGNGGKLLSTLRHDDFWCTYQITCVISTCSRGCCRQHNCSCDTFCYPQCTCYNTNDNSINTMNCTARGLTALPIQGPTDAKSISIDGNNLSSLNSSGLKFPGLEILYINKSHVSQLEPGVFRHLKRIRVLDLHQNEIRYIRRDTLSDIGTLKQLCLHENMINVIDSDSFNDLTNLESLTLHKNDLQFVNLTVFDDLASLTALTLHDNPWVCDCQFGTEFQKWLVSNAKVVSIPTEIYCRIAFLPSSPNELYQPVLDIDFSICSNLTGSVRVDYSHSKSIVEGISIVAVFTLLVSISLVLYTKRFLLKVWMYNKYGLCFNSQDDDDKEYDVFIAYSKEDDALVINELLPELEEGQVSFKVCIEGRDWPAATATTDMFVSAIQKSKLTMLLLTENYFNDQWCEYCFDQGLYQVLKDKQMRLLIILTDRKLLDADMSLSMKQYLKMNPFLVMGEKWFWKKLLYYLPHNPQGADEVTGRQFEVMQVC